MIGLAIKEITHRKVRSWMTVIGIVIGVSAIVSLFLLGDGLTRSIQEQFSAVGTDKIFVLPGSSFLGMFFHELTQEDLETLSSLDGLKKVSGVYSKQATIEWHDNKEQVHVSGLKKKFNALEFGYGVGLHKGRYLKEDKEAIIGYELWSGNLFQAPLKLGDEIKINQKKFKVVGLMDRIGNKQDDSQVMISLEAMWELTGRKDRYTLFVAQVKKPDELNLMVDKIKKALRKKHGVKEGEEDFTVQTTEDLMESFLKVFNIVKYFVLGIAGISILVGCIGIMNVMYSSILERRREIGIMRSIGCTRKKILTLFLIESGLFGLFGGIIGAGLGTALAKLFELSAKTGAFGALKIYINPLFILFSIGGSFLVSSLAGLLPAIKATKIEISEAIRWE